MTLFDQDNPEPARSTPPNALRQPEEPGPGQPDGPPPAADGPPRLARTPDDEEYIEVKAGPGPLRKLLAILVVFGFVIGIALGGAYWWYRRQVDPPGSPGAEVTVVIPKGSSTSGIGGVLEKADVITNKTVFTFYVRRKNAGPFEAGRFVVRKRSDFDSVIRVLERGPIPPRFTRVNLPEGLTLAELSAKLHDSVARYRHSDVLAALRSGRVRSTLRQGSRGSWEGLLFPASYDVGARTEVASVLSQMAAKMEAVARQEGITPRTAALRRKYGINLNPYRALIIASLIQEEAGSAAEAPKIATVIYNRLRQGLPLGIDATSRYVAQATGKKIDFSSASPYNTRRRPGLPPTPIATPSRYAIRAALRPAEGRWLYYVLTSPGKHTFAVTNAQFLAAKEVCKAKDLGCG